MPIPPTTTIEILATVLFVLAVLHTFFCGQFQRLAHRYPEGSISENLFHLLGEVEVVFGLWASILIGLFAVVVSPSSAITYAESLNFTEPMFVFVIMATAATKPVIEIAKFLIFASARFLPIKRDGVSPSETAVFLSCLIVGPLLGSFITEPAAMTLTALIMKERYFNSETTLRFKYVAIATLFVNVSIGGTLTPFAAPPVLMVANQWNWDIAFMLQNFGWKAFIATIVNAILAAFILRKELSQLSSQKVLKHSNSSPAWLRIIHILFLALIVMTSHHPVIFIGLFLLFFGLTVMTQEYQSPLPLRQSLLVAFFLGGLVVLGGLQEWWLKPALAGLSNITLFLGTTGLTALTDNAALTYLGSQIEGVSESFKYSLVAGAVTGGGLTVIANAPNPAGFSILQHRFGESGIDPLRLFLYALLPTAVSMICFWPY